MWDQSSFTSFSAGARYATRDVDQTFGRYLINGTLSNGQVAGGDTGCNSATAPNVCGPWLYYQDPGYDTSEYSLLHRDHQSGTCHAGS